MRITTFSLAFLFLLLFSYYAKSQENVIIDKDNFKISKEGYKKAWSSVKLADKYYIANNKGSYLLALEYYLEGYKYNPENAQLNYKIGISYLGSILKANSLSYLEKAYTANSKVATDIVLQLAYSYQYNYQFEKAIEFYNTYKSSLKSVDLKKVQKTIDLKIEQCNNGLTYYNNPTYVDIVNITTLNSQYPDYCPLISADESMMIFTSRRPEGINAETDITDGQYYEDIYVANNIKSVWQPAKNIGKPLNSQYHDATVGLAPDGQSMLIYRNGDIYICYLKGESWTEPELLPEVINTESIENSACFSFDGNSIYFIRGKTDDATTSNGDIYVSKKKKGVWGKALKLSKVVNTTFDEDGVFMHPDGRTLYFSSKGHNTMGGYDIFSTILQTDGTWTEPVNLGYPINTPDDDVYFVLSANGMHGYYSSIKEDALGFTDIYMINFAKEKPVVIDTLVQDSVPLVVEVAVVNTVRLTIVKGIISDAVSLEPIEATIEIYDNTKNELVSEQKSNSSTGKYLVSLPSGRNYGLVVKADNYLFHSENFDIAESETYNEIIKDIALMPIEQGAKVVLNNIFFDVNKSVLRSESLAELERLKAFMTEHSDLKIEISGHTDNTGSYALNKQLSEDRAKSVVDYLIENKIPSSKLTYRGASYDEPIASNDTEEGRQLNRRVEFKIIN